MRPSLFLVLRRLKIQLSASLSVQKTALALLIVVSTLGTALTFLFLSKSPGIQLLVSKADLGDYCGLLTVNGGLLDNAGLGNKMFAYATLLGLANATRKQPILPQLFADHLRTSFPITAPAFEFGFSIWLFESFSLPYCCTYKSHVEIGIPCGGLQQVNGYLQSWRYFHPHLETKIRSEFKFHEHIRLRANHRLKDILFESSLMRGYDPELLVGVHTRTGDFNNEGAQAYGHQSAIPDYVHLAFRYYRKTFDKQKILFIIVGEEREWNVENFGSVVDAVIVTPETGDSDLALLTLCNHSIITTGTFGWWSAYLANGHVTYQQEYARPFSLHADEYVEADYFPPNWVPL